jgi:hypothetical protein
MGFAAVMLGVGFVLTLAQDEFGLSDGIVLALIGAFIIGLLVLADWIEGRPPAGSVPRR